MSDHAATVRHALRYALPTLTPAAFAALDALEADLAAARDALRPFAATACVHEDGPNRDMSKPRNASECKYCIARAALAEADR